MKRLGALLAGVALAAGMLAAAAPAYADRSAGPSGVSVQTSFNDCDQSMGASESIVWHSGSNVRTVSVQVNLAPMCPHGGYSSPAVQWFVKAPGASWVVFRYDTPGQDPDNVTLTANYTPAQQPDVGHFFLIRVWPNYPINTEPHADTPYLLD